MKLKIYFISAAVFTILLTCESYPQTIQHYNFKLKENSGIPADSQKKQLTEKSPMLAGTLSFIVPGFALGQLYNGQTSKFFAHSLISFGTITALILSSGKLIQIDITGGGGGKGVGLFLALVFIYTANWVWSTVDAVNSAHDINKKVMLQKYRSDILNKFGFGLSYDKNKNLNLNFSVRL